MTCHVQGCLGNYDFEHIVVFAIRRFVEGFSTIALLEQAKTEREKEEIALVSLLDLEDNNIRDLHLCCANSAQCKVIDCRDRLKRMIEDEIARR
ncbi:MAG: hypothetical protein WBO34_08610 [Gammaproteobacteria bacterium]